MKKLKIVVKGDVLKKWLDENGPKGRLKLAMVADLDPTVFDKMASNQYDHNIKEAKRKLICKTMKVEESKLFQKIWSTSGID